MLHVSYTGIGAAVLRYHCKGAHVNHGEHWCISFGGLRTDEAVAREVLHAISGNAVEAALEAAEQMRQQRRDQRTALELEAEQARYQAHLASRRYEAVDPDNRLVAAELEARWNAELQRVHELEAKLQEFDVSIESVPMPDKEVLLSLARDLPAVWNAPSTDMRLKQRIVRILVHEIVADVDEKASEIVLVIHWTGGQHSDLRIKKNGLGRHRRCTSVEAIEVIRQMAGKFQDEQIAATLNRLGLLTGTGQTWSENRVYSARHYHQLLAYDPDRTDDGMVTMEEAAQRLGVSSTSIRRMIKLRKIPATQVVACAPWQIPKEALESEEVRKAVRNIKARARAPRTHGSDRQQAMFTMA
jgi:excisionase family DNA binding protein